jgi:hypothetical protein
VELNGTGQLLACANNVSLQTGNTNTMKKNMESLLDAIKEVDLQVTAEKTKCIFMSVHQN